MVHFANPLDLSRIAYVIGAHVNQKWIDLAKWDLTRFIYKMQEWIQPPIPEPVNTPP
jgi:hypothetical protein